MSRGPRWGVALLGAAMLIGMVLGRIVPPDRAAPVAVVMLLVAGAGLVFLSSDRFAGSAAEKSPAREPTPMHAYARDPMREVREDSAPAGVLAASIGQEAVRGELGETG